ncbi:MAG: alanine--glyoxylate aminotransferase family protein [Phycisphaerae bacterium]|nr:alanine--glyoxylate aminotransferase family protein [Phycisphaerae bacterium]
MKHVRLLTPGPTMVPQEILAEMARPTGHHRSAESRRALREVTEALQYLFQTNATCLTVTGSGSAAMEAAIVTTCAPGRKALVIRSGKFGERWAKVCAAFGIDHVTYDVDWGTAPSAEGIAEQLAADASIGYVIVVHCETSTATACDLEAIAKAVRSHDVLLIVDAVASAGAIPLRMDAWGVDVAVVGGQKAPMLPPGLSFVAVNDRAWAVADSFAPPAFYLDLKAYRKALAADYSPPYTPSVPLIMAARKALASIREMGIEAVWAKVATLARATRAAGEAIGLSLFSKAPSDSVTAFCVPDGIDDAVLRGRLRDEYGVLIAGGQDRLKGRIVRIGHLGHVDAVDTLGALAALEIVLNSMGYSCTLGAGVAAAQRVLAASAS